MADLFLPPAPLTPAPKDDVAAEPGIHNRSKTPRIRMLPPPITPREMMIQTPMVSGIGAEDCDRYTPWKRDSTLINSPFDDWAQMCAEQSDLGQPQIQTQNDILPSQQLPTSAEGQNTTYMQDSVRNFAINTSNATNEQEGADISLQGTNECLIIPDYNESISQEHDTPKQEDSCNSSHETNHSTRHVSQQWQHVLSTETLRQHNMAQSPVPGTYKLRKFIGRKRAFQADAYDNQTDSPSFSGTTHSPLSSPQSFGFLPRNSSNMSSLLSDSDNVRASSVESSCSTLSGISRLSDNTLPDERLLKDVVQRYLKLKDDMRLVILNAKVAQKSYGSEKRFLCPPPCIHLLGTGWKTKMRRKMASSSPSPISPYSSSSSSSTQSYRAMKNTDVCVFMGIGGTEAEMQQVHLDPLKKYGSSKTLHTPDSDKRKYFDIQVKMFYGDGSEIGSFRSKRIKVISKPSKKKQTVKNTDLCILSGSKVSLFNRFRAQTVSTRYLYANNGGFCASATQWGAFSVYIVDSKSKETKCIDASDGYIHYGQTLKLVCSVTGVALPRLIIRKVDKKMAVLDTDEPISQLHKCALFLKDTDRQYVCLTQEKIIAYIASPSTKHKGRDVLNDGSCWTIISTEKAEYIWTDTMLNLHHNNPVTPIPVPISLQVNGGVAVRTVEIIGENFTPNLTVWFAQVEAETMFRCQECIMAIVPDVNKINANWKCVRGQIKVPLLLIREDGVIYPTRMYFSYTKEAGPKKIRHPTIREIIKSKKVKKI